MAAAFHRFNQLPLELRQHVWELSLDPRRVPVGNFSDPEMPPPPPIPPPAPPPAALHACVESRSYLARYYTKIFKNGSSSRYIWVNYELDTICMNFWTLIFHPDQLPPIRHFSVVCNDYSIFYHDNMKTIRFMPSLEDLELRLVQEGDPWWYHWTRVMRYWYHCDDPVSFRAIIVSPVPDDKVPELNMQNYLNVNYGQRDWDAYNRETFGNMRQLGW